MSRGRHAKRTTVRRVDDGWQIDLATYDRPTVTQPVASHAMALAIAQRFERSKARARFIESRRGLLVDVG